MARITRLLESGTDTDFYFHHFQTGYRFIHLLVQWPLEAISPEPERPEREGNLPDPTNTVPAFNFFMRALYEIGYSSPS